MTRPDKDDTPENSWWQPVLLVENQLWHCALGAIDIYLQRHDDAWQLAWRGADDRPEIDRFVSEPEQGFPADLDVNRYVFRRPPESFHLQPRLLDRSIVIATVQPVKIPPREKITFYISSPVSVEVMLAGVETPLEQIPTVRLSDSWFGPTTREGDVCYAARTTARNRREEVVSRPNRAVTPVILHNRSSDMLAIEELSIPVPFLSIYAEPDGSLWTEPVSLEHTDESPLANFRIGKRLAGTTLLSPPREAASRKGVMRAVINLLSG